MDFIRSHYIMPIEPVATTNLEVSGMNVENACVKMWEQDIEIPTYPVGTPDKNPMFLEKRVYQGSSGRVYPHSVIDKIGDTKGAKRYHAVFLENEYLRIMVLPELCLLYTSPSPRDCS